MLSVQHAVIFEVTVALVTIMLTATICLLVIQGKTVTTELVGLETAVMGFLFGTRTGRAQGQLEEHQKQNGGTP